MTVDIATLGVAFDTKGLKAGQAEFARTQAAANKTADATDRVGKQAEKAGGGFRAMTSSLGAFRSAVGALGVIALGTSFVRLADSVTVLNNQLRLATGSASNASKAYSELYRVAQSARVSFSDLGSTYAQIARSTQELGISNSRLMNVTEAIGNAMTVSGGSAAGMNAALIQLSQGFAAGALRGEELNSVMEQTPRLAQAIAKGMGITLGELRAMGQAGALTSEAVIKALESQADVLRNEVQSATLTVGQATTMLGNAMTNLVGELDKTTNASGIVANTFKALALEIDGVNAVMNQTAADGGGSLLQVLNGIGASIGRFSFALAGESVSQFNWVVDKLTGGIFGLNTQVDLMPDNLRPMNEQIQITAARLVQAEAEYAKLSKQLENAPDNIYIKSDIGNLNRYIAKLKEAQAEQARLTGKAAGSTMGSGSVGSGDTALLRAQRAQWDAMAGIRAKYMEDARTDVQKLNDELAKASKAFGGVIPAEVEASLRAKFIKPMKEAKKDTEAARLELQLFEQELATFTAAEEVYGEQNRLNREMREEQEKTAQATRDAYAEMIEARQDNASSLAEQIIKEQEAIAVMGLTRLELGELEAAKLNDAAASKERLAVIADEVDWSGQAGDAYRAEADQLRQLADLKRKGAIRSEAVDAAKDAAKEWQKTADKIEDMLTDALMRGFENGESFGENLSDSIVNTFKTYVAKEISKAITKAILSALAQTQWGSALSSVLGGVTGGGGGTDWISLATKGYQYMSGGGAAASTAATYGTTVGSQQTTMLAAQEAGMGGGSAAGIGALGWAAIIAAAIYAGSELYDAGYDRTNLQGIGESNRYDLGVENLLYKINEQTGLLNEKWANIMSGTTRMAHMLGYKLHQTGIRGNFDGAGGIQTDQYESYKGGWLRGSDKVFSAPLEANRAASLTSSLADIQDSTEVLVRAMGGNADAVRDFAGSVTINLRGLTQSEAAQKMAEEFQDLQFRMAEAAGISRDAFAEMMAMAQSLAERFGATGPAIADLLVQGMTGRLSAGDLSAQLADVIMGGIYNSIASVYADPIAQMFTSQIIQPILTAALSGAPLAGIVSQATMQGVVNQARVSMATLNQIFQDPAFKQFMSELEGTIKQVSTISVQPAKHIKAFGTAALKTGVQVNTAQKEWEALANSIVDEIRRIRGEILGSTPDGLSNLKAQFATTTARARAGSQDAAEQLPGLSRELIELARETSLTMSDFRATQAYTLDSLQDTAKQIAKKYKFKLPSFDVGTDYVPQDMVAMLHQGEKVTPKAFNKSGSDSSNAELVAESKAQRAVIVSMAATINRLEQGMSKLTSGYNVLRNQEVTA